MNHISEQTSAHTLREKQQEGDHENQEDTDDAAPITSEDRVEIVTPFLVRR